MSAKSKIFRFNSTEISFPKLIVSEYSLTEKYCGSFITIKMLADFQFEIKFRKIIFRCKCILQRN